MDINAINTRVDFSSVYASQNTTGSQADVSTTTTNTDNVVIGSVNGDNSATASIDSQDPKKPFNLPDLKKKTDAMNQFMEAMNSTLRFNIDEKTNELTVQFVDQATGKVLQQFPPQYFLNTIAAIRNYVGVLLDKKI